MSGKLLDCPFIESFDAILRVYTIRSGILNRRTLNNFFSSMRRDSFFSIFHSFFHAFPKRAISTVFRVIILSNSALLLPMKRKFNDNTIDRRNENCAISRIVDPKLSNYNRLIETDYNPRSHQFETDQNFN